MLDAIWPFAGLHAPKMGKFLELHSNAHAVCREIRSQNTHVSVAHLKKQAVSAIAVLAYFPENRAA
jgi:phosphopantetheinyl transferase (holo-ACP synthase)